MFNIDDKVWFVVNSNANLSSDVIACGVVTAIIETKRKTSNGVSGTKVIYEIIDFQDSVYKLESEKVFSSKMEAVQSMISSGEYLEEYHERELNHIRERLARITGFLVDDWVNE